MKKQGIAILGLGIFGSATCKTLSRYETDIVAIDIDEKNVERIKDYVTEGVVADFTDFDTLKALAIDQVDVAIVASGSSLESSILAIMNLQKLGVKQIIAKAKNKIYMEIYQQLGVTRVIRPEKEMGEKLAKDLVRTELIESYYLDDQYSLVEFCVPYHWVKHSIIELNLRNKYGINVIGIKAVSDAKLTVDFLPNEILKESQIIVAVVDNHRFDDALSLK